jgi:hypothetical protein
MQSQETLPNFFDILSDADKFGYNCLRNSISTVSGSRNMRNKRVQNFAETLDLIRRFCHKGDSDDWKRCIVCGVCWLFEGIAINTRQLKILISKCKSSINGSFHKMGFTANLGCPESAAAIARAIPFLKGNVNELRQWTVRQSPIVCRSPISPPSPPNFAFQNKFEIPLINVIQNQLPPPKPFPIPRINFPKTKQQEQFVHNPLIELPIDQTYDTAMDEYHMEHEIMNSIEEPFPFDPWSN